MTGKEIQMLTEIHDLEVSEMMQESICQEENAVTFLCETSTEDIYGELPY